jgi:hypothetical protein
MPPNRPKGVRFVEATGNEFVVDNELGRIVVEVDTVRFHRAGHERGRVILTKDSLRNVDLKAGSYPPCR